MTDDMHIHTSFFQQASDLSQQYGSIRSWSGVLAGLQRPLAAESKMSSQEPPTTTSISTKNTGSSPTSEQETSTMDADDGNFGSGEDVQVHIHDRHY